MNLDERNIFDRSAACMKLVSELLDPEQFGYSCSAEVRDAARRALGIIAPHATLECKTLRHFKQESDSSEPECCNGNCRQGRDCPLRNPKQMSLNPNAQTRSQAT